MCGTNLLLFFGLIAADAVVLSTLAEYVDGGWIWLWHMVTAYVGWQLAKQSFRSQRQGGGVNIRLNGTFRAPLFLLMPGLITDGLATAELLSRYVASRRYLGRRRVSNLWVGEPDRHGVIPVEAVRVEPPKTDEN